MLYLFFGILTFWYFRKKWGQALFVKSKKITISNLLAVMVLILAWPVFAIIEIFRRIRGKK